MIVIGIFPLLCLLENDLKYAKNSVVEKRKPVS